MRKLLALLGVLALTACTPAERYLYDAWHQVNPYEAEANAIKLKPGETVDPATFTAIVDRIHHLEALPTCELYDQWLDAAGLPSHFHAVMRRESMCQPDAHNPSGATGLLQVMPMWADDCGGTPADLYDPRFNIDCAVHIYTMQGGQAWSTW